MAQMRQPSKEGRFSVRDRPAVALRVAPHAASVEVCRTANVAHKRHLSPIRRVKRVLGVATCSAAFLISKAWAILQTTAIITVIGAPEMRRFRFNGERPVVN